MGTRLKTDLAGVVRQTPLIRKTMSIEGKTRWEVDHEGTMGNYMYAVNDANTPESSFTSWCRINHNPASIVPQ